jgi:hypothetical protein
LHYRRRRKLLRCQFDNFALMRLQARQASSRRRRRPEWLSLCFFPDQAA